MTQNILFALRIRISNPNHLYFCTNKNEGVENMEDPCIYRQEFVNHSQKYVIRSPNTERGCFIFPDSEIPLQMQISVSYPGRTETKRKVIIIFWTESHNKRFRFPFGWPQVQYIFDYGPVNLYEIWNWETPVSNWDGLKLGSIRWNKYAKPYNASFPDNKTPYKLRHWMLMKLWKCDFFVDFIVLGGQTQA